MRIGREVRGQPSIARSSLRPTWRGARAKGASQPLPPLGSVKGGRARARNSRSRQPATALPFVAHAKADTREKQQDRDQSDHQAVAILLHHMDPMRADGRALGRGSRQGSMKAGDRDGSVLHNMASQ